MAAAVGEPPEFIYNFQTTRSSVKPKNDATYIITSELGSDPHFKWRNTGRRNSRGQTEWVRATRRRKNPAYKAYHETMMNNLAERMLASNFGTRKQYKRGPNGRIVQVNVPEYAEYDASTRNALARAGIPNRARVGPTGLATSAAVPSNNNIAMAMGAMGLGKGGKTRRRKHTLRKKRRHTRRN